MEEVRSCCEEEGLGIEQQDKRLGIEIWCSSLSVCVDSLDMGDERRDSAPTVLSDMKKMATGIFSTKPLVTKHILKNISVKFSPGTMTLVLGQPGSGKSTLLKVLASRFPEGKKSRIEGYISYNGVERSTILKAIPSHVAFVAQKDIHYPNLTVSETLAFASQCCGNDAMLRDQWRSVVSPSDLVERGHCCDAVIRQLGLNACSQTVIGDVMTRGVSGGERRRVSLGEMLFGDRQLMLFDDMTTGLDSATALDIISSQLTAAQKANRTVVMSLLQPSPEIFDCFDNVVVLNAGELLYFGPCCEVANYFERIGYHCPPDRNIADFLVDLGTDRQDQYAIPLSDGSKHPRAAREFSLAFSSTQASENLSFSDSEHSNMALRPRFAQSFTASTMTLLKRQIKLTLCSPMYIFWRLAAATIIGVLYGTLYYRFDLTKTVAVGGSVLTLLLFVGLRQAIDNIVFLETREIFYKQRGAYFYRTSSYLIANALCNTPLAAIETFICGSIIYWACGFAASVLSFVLFEVLLLLTGLCFSAWFNFVAALSPNIHISDSISMLSMFLYIMFAGAPVSKGAIPSFLMWIYWVNPMAWSFRSIMVLQYRHKSLDICVYGGNDYCSEYGQTMGEFYLRGYGIPPEKHWIWLGFVYLVVIYIVFMVMTNWALEHHRLESPTSVNSRPEKFDNPQDIHSYMEVSTPNGAGIELKVSEEAEYYGQHQIQPVILAFKNICYSVPDPKNRKENIDLLKGVSGYAMPCTITALMGASGAGKTTLMDVIAGRKTGGFMEGQVLLNGYPATDLAIRRSTGYCEQMDVHSETATFREALLFSAFLRQDSGEADEVKRSWVNECIELLELQPIADNIIRGSSQERLKRLTIGVELAARPSLLFLDEPTSGLDARAAHYVMEGVRKVADTGLTVVCTIHQPSPQVFDVFDKLLLLEHGGEMVFFGDLGGGAREMIEYFESFEVVQRFEKGNNPAAWMLDAISAGIVDSESERRRASNGSQANFVTLFAKSELNHCLVSTLSQDGVCSPSPSALPILFTSKRAASHWTQMCFLVIRFFRMYWRSSAYTLTRCFAGLIAAFAYALLFEGAEYRSLEGVNSGIGILYATIIFNGVISFDTAFPFAFQDRGAFYRERSVQTYSAFWYFFASTVVEVPFVVFSSLLFTASYFPIVGFSGVEHFLIFWLSNVLLVLVQTYFGMLFAAIFPTMEIAAGVGTLLTSIFIVHIGYNPPASTLPAGYKIIYHVTPQKYILAIMAATIFADCPSDRTGGEYGCALLENAPPTLPANITVKEFVESMYWMKHDEIWINVGFVLLIVVVFRILALVALRHCNHQTK